jgi:hypothetical protein
MPMKHRYMCSATVCIMKLMMCRKDVNTMIAYINKSFADVRSSVQRLFKAAGAASMQLPRIAMLQRLAITLCTSSACAARGSLPLSLSQRMYAKGFSSTCVQVLSLPRR